MGSAEELGTRSTDVKVSWVKGHSTRTDVERGRTTDEDKRGNDGADALAVAGARMYSACPEVVSAARKRQKWAVSVQQMMLSVLQARYAAEHATQRDAEEADRGSETGCLGELILDDDVDDRLAF